MNEYICIMERGRKDEGEREKTARGGKKSRRRKKKPGEVEKKKMHRSRNAKRHFAKVIPHRESDAESRKTVMVDI